MPGKHEDLVVFEVEEQLMGWCVPFKSDWKHRLALSAFLSGSERREFETWMAQEMLERVNSGKFEGIKYADFGPHLPSRVWRFLARRFVEPLARSQDRARALKTACTSTITPKRRRAVLRLVRIKKELVAAGYATTRFDPLHLLPLGTKT